MGNHIMIFTLDGCEHCVSLKKRLSDLSIIYYEIEILKNKELWDSILLQIKEEILPTTIILNSETNHSQILIPGISYKTEDEIVNIIKSKI